MTAHGPERVLWMRPKRWRDFQHYHDKRRLAWIKNYIEIDLPGSKFRQLSWADQGRLQALWRLAARLDHGGLIPYDEKYLRDALGDKRFPLASHLVNSWFHIGDEAELKKAANGEKRSSKTPQKPSLEVRGKRKKEQEPRAVPALKGAQPSNLLRIDQLIDQSLAEAVAQ